MKNNFAQTLFSKIIILRKYFLPIFISFSAVLLLFPTVYCFTFKNKIYPGIFINNLALSGKTKEETKSFLKKYFTVPKEITLLSDNEKFSLSLSEIQFSYNLEETAEIAFNIYRYNNPYIAFLNQLANINNKKNINLSIEYDQGKLDEYINIISEQLNTNPVYPSLNLVGGNITIEKGRIGKEINKNQLKNIILNNLKSANFSPIQISFNRLDPQLSNSEAELLLQKANLVLNKKIVLKHDDVTFILKGEDLFLILNTGIVYNQSAFLSLIERIKNEFERDSQNAVFKFETNADGSGKVVEFIPAKYGFKIDNTSLIENLSEAIIFLELNADNSKEIEVQVSTSPPEITTESINSFGVRELIGKGTSKFAGSISARIHNVGIASSKFNGILIAPNETLSFNETLGDVSTLTGYKQAYIIKDGKTVLGDGGGVCQVSTTLFRAALDAGLPVIERRAHSYRVAYYEQDSKPGLDATVYDPTTDLKFKNDTPGHILIQTIYNPKTFFLSFEFYGTSDGRVSSITTPVVTEATPPPEDLYIDDPSLPAGETKQIDYKAWGAKVNFSYIVKRDGKTILEKTFKSVYQPWQAKYLRGTGNLQH